ncbi:MAG: tetratricopeptide repeat protein [Myxococcaceae bacterium]
MNARIPKARAARLLEQARLHLDKNEPKAALPLLLDVRGGSNLHLPELFIALGDAYFQSGKAEDALTAYEEGRKSFPKDPELLGRVGVAQLRLGNLEESLKALYAAEQKLRRDPNVHNYLGQALLRAGRATEAEEKLRRAQGLGAGMEVRLFIALALGKQGRFSDAEAVLTELERHAPSAELKAAAKTARADCRLFLNDAKGALALWSEVRKNGQLDADALGHMAYAAQLCGDPALADELMAERLGKGATPEDRLLFAQIANLRGQGSLALERLSSQTQDSAEVGPGFAFEMNATRARALRLLGERDKAKLLLEQLLEWPEAKSPRLGPRVHVDFGRLLVDDGDLVAARGWFERALALDPHDPEASYGMKLTSSAVPSKAEDAAVAETASFQRHFSQREGEMEKLREELERLRAEQKRSQEALEQARRVAAEVSRKAAEQAAKAAEEARRTMEREQGRRMREELLARESEITEKAFDEIERALGDHADACPEPLRTALDVAERTFQKALYTELPAAAVSVLYAGALERALYLQVVERFRGWLARTKKLEEFLSAAVRERRGKRVEYFDHFVEACDADRPGKAPGLGEIARVLERRREPYLKTFRDFLSETFDLTDERWDQLAEFVQWSKEHLRDPVAHGRAAEMGYDELRKFRVGMLQDLAGTGRGVMYYVLATR